MKHYGEFGGCCWALHAGDYRDVIGSIECDHTITDPPYSQYVLDRMLSVTKTKGAPRKIDGGFAGIESVSDEDLISLVSKARRWSLLFCGLEELGHNRNLAPELWVRSGIYCKIRAVPQLSGDRPGNRTEGVSIFHSPGKKRWSGGGGHAFWVAMPESRKTTYHPTAKPLKLCRELIELFTDPGDTIFDPFAGVASIGVAALALGRNYIGCEIDPVFARIAVTNLTDPLVCIATRSAGSWDSQYKVAKVADGEQ